MTKITEIEDPAILCSVKDNVDTFNHNNIFPQKRMAEVRMKTEVWETVRTHKKIPESDSSVLVQYLIQSLLLRFLALHETSIWCISRRIRPRRAGIWLAFAMFDATFVELPFLQIPHNPRWGGRNLNGRYKISSESFSRLRVVAFNLISD